MQTVEMPISFLTRFIYKIIYIGDGTMEIWKEVYGYDVLFEVSNQGRAETCCGYHWRYDDVE